MKFWFSKKKNSNENNKSKNNNDEIYNAVLKNREAIDALEKKQVQVEKKIKQMEIEAKEKVQKKQLNNAKILLKRKKLYEHELQNILNNRLTLEDNMISLENMQLHKIAINALSYTAVTHKKMNNEISVQKVEKIMDSIQENKEALEEVNQALNFNLVNNIDDDEIENELNLLQANEENTIEENKIENTINNDQINENKYFDNKLIDEINQLPQPPNDVVKNKKIVKDKNNQNNKISEDTDDELNQLIGELN